MEFGETILFPSYGEIEALMPDLIGGGEQPYDLMSYSSVYFGDIVATGQVEPLDRYLEQYHRHRGVHARRHARLSRVLYQVRR